ncbi:MAG: metallophosphoesterase family protein [Candidatus Zixiibacteriota bacterium]
MTLFVISDTHVPEISQKIPEEFLSQIKAQDILFHAGDFANLQTLKELERRCKVYAVHGNMDDSDVKKLLPDKRIVEISGKRIGIIHGWGAPFDLAQRIKKKFEQDLDVLIFGHSHTPYHKKDGKTLLFNPGSLGSPSFKNKTYGILNLEEKEIWGDIQNL